MKSRSCMADAFAPLKLLAMMFCLAGCQSVPTIPTAATKTEADIVADLCEHTWRPVTYSSHDTEQTRLETRANNAARDAYCGD